MTRRTRLDAELVRRGLARSRDHATELIRTGRVVLDGAVSTKPSTGVSTAAAIVVHAGEPGVGFVSRGGDKLAGALGALTADGLRVAHRRCLDAGASTGGFTDALLQWGAAFVIAVDVGYGQLSWRLRCDPRVDVRERTNIRYLGSDSIGGPVDLVVADLSFVSLRLVLPALVGACRDDGDLVLLVKPQFEVGRERLGRGGVVRDLPGRAAAVRDVSAAAHQLGWGSRAVVASTLLGPAGNAEFFLWLRRGGAPLEPTVVDAAVAAAPRGEKVTP